MQLPQSLHDRLLRAHAAARRHPRRVAAAVLTVLGGTAGTAFGIAPRAPEASQLPVRAITETLEIQGLDSQLDALSLHRLELVRHDTTRRTDTADSLLARLGVSDPLASGFLRRDADARRLLLGEAGKLVQARAASDGTLIELVARFPALDSSRVRSHFTRLTVERGADGMLQSRLEQAPLVAQARLGSGVIRSSLWAATDTAQLPDAIASQLIEIFSADVDFHRELKRGDSFSVVYEALTADDQPITWAEGTGRILAAEFVNAGRVHQAVWFSTGPGQGAYFGPDGSSRQRSFLASPLEFSRVTSGFAMRFHPILQNWRAHNGVDYAAPVGTPVRTVAHGTVKFAGRQNGYGNVVELEHPGGRSTLYAHLSRIDVRVGQRVEQGQTIGAVGATGWATGPHLHFEFKVNGQVRDPLTIARESDTLRLDRVARARFDLIAQQVQHKLQAAQTLTAFRADAE